jgi:hypothetical protein
MHLSERKLRNMKSVRIPVSFYTDIKLSKLYSAPLTFGPPHPPQQDGNDDTWQVTNYEAPFCVINSILLLCPAEVLSSAACSLIYS